MRQRWFYLFVFVVVGLFLLSCQPSGTAGSQPTSSKGGGCSNVETRLKELLDSGSRSSYAREHGLALQGDRVLVVVELKGADQALPAGYDFEQQSNQGNLIQGFLNVDQLCRLAAETPVDRIRVPAVPQPLN